VLERKIRPKSSQNETKNECKTSNKGAERSNFKFGRGYLLKKTHRGAYWTATSTLCNGLNLFQIAKEA